jgi:hypothetical protein
MNTGALIATYTTFSEVIDWVINFKLSTYLVFPELFNSLVVLLFVPI